MKQYKSLDLAKFICAILIIILHTAPFSSYSKVLTFGLRNIVTVIAVPFFFCTSGFLAFKKIDSLESKQKKKYVSNYLKRLGIMYLVWSVVYFIFVVIKWTRGDFSIYSVLEYIRDFFFEGSYSTIWFLPALFAATFIIYLLRKKLSYKVIFIISCIVWVFTLGGSSYYGFVSKVPFIELIYNFYYRFFDSVKNGVCFGMIFVCMGAMMAEKEEELTNNNSSVKVFVPVAMFAVLLAIEEFLVAYFDWNIRGVDTVICLVPFTYFFFQFVLLFQINVKDNICIAMRKYSILMFLCQRIPLSIIELFMVDTIVATNSILHFITVLSVTLLISFLIIQCSKKYKAFKYIY